MFLPDTIKSISSDPSLHFSGWNAVSGSILCCSMVGSTAGNSVEIPVLDMILGRINQCALAAADILTFV